MRIRLRTSGPRRTKSSGMILAQQKVADQSNEIPALRELLEPPRPGRVVITAEVMHTQTDTTIVTVRITLRPHQHTSPPLRSDNHPLIDFTGFSWLGVWSGLGRCCWCGGRGLSGMEVLALSIRGGGAKCLTLSPLALT